MAWTSRRPTEDADVGNSCQTALISVSRRSTERTEIQIDKYRTPPESIVGQDVVVWYCGHFTHAPLGPHVSHVVGPELRPVNW